MAGGRITAVFVMMAGVGIIGYAASILASVLVASPEAESTEGPTGSPADSSPDVHDELRAIRAELEALHKTIGAQNQDP